MARVGSEAITVQELEWQMRLVPRVANGLVVLAEERKRRALEQLVQQAAIVAEARRRGLEQDPQIQQILKQQLATRLVQEEIDIKLTDQPVPEAEVERHYRENLEDFQRPEEVRATQIVLRDQGKAKEVATRARAARRPNDAGADQRAFGELVAQHSEDSASKLRGGDLGFFSRKSAALPRAVVEVAFSLAEVGAVSEPVGAEGGYHILKLTARRPGSGRSLAEAAPMIRQKLLRQIRDRRYQALLTELRQKVKVEVFEEKMAAVGDEPTAAAPGE